MCVACGCESTLAETDGTEPAETNAASSAAAAFQVVARLDQVSDARPLGVRVDGQPVVVGRVGGQVYAIGGLCSHRQGRLEEGTLANGTVTCPLHGATFDLRTGNPTRGPAAHAVPSYEVRIEGERVLIARRSAERAPESVR